MKKFATICVLILIAAGLYWQRDAVMAFFNPGEQAEKAGQARVTSAIKVITTPVEFTANDLVFEAVGTGRARLSVGIFPAVSEEVTAVNFTAQQNVEKGDVLVQLDDRAEKLAVRLAEVALKDAKSLLARYEQAVKEGAVPQSEVDAARADYDSAQVALDQAKLALDERRITAPFAGVVGIASIDPGDRVGPDTFITGLDARDTLFVDFEVPEALAGALGNAQAEAAKITATTPAYAQMTFNGTIAAQESRIDPQRRTLMARAAIANTDDLLRPGMSFAVRWDIPGKSYATVPEISLQWGRNGSYVWLVRDGKAEKVMGRVVSRRAGLVLLDGDIKKGEPVVVEGVQRVRPGADVEILGADNQ